MNFNMKNRTIALASVLLFSTASAFAAGAQDSVVQEQKSLLQKLDSLQESVIGLKLNGTAKAGALASLAKSDQFSEDSPTHETQAYTDVNLLLTARPSSETMVTLQLRLHKDWQSAFDENNNPVIGHWFSYDGSILNKHLDFNLGYMRVAYTPLTLFAPQPFLLQEPEIFAQERVEALAQRNLDTTSRRLLQGSLILSQSSFAVTLPNKKAIYFIFLFSARCMNRFISSPSTSSAFTATPLSSFPTRRIFFISFLSSLTLSFSFFNNCAGNTTIISSTPNLTAFFISACFTLNEDVPNGKSITAETFTSSPSLKFSARVVRYAGEIATPP